MTVVEVDSSYRRRDGADDRLHAGDHRNHHGMDLAGHLAYTHHRAVADRCYSPVSFFSYCRLADHATLTWGGGGCCWKLAVEL
jgi:hypothetical protein